MAETFWGFFEEYGTGGFAADAWIRGGQLIGNAFTWLTDRIAFPDQVWNYLPDNSFTGYLKADLVDTDKLWVAATVLDGSDLYSRIYLYSIADSTWTLLLDVLFTGGSTPFCVDMAQDTVDGTMFAAIGSNGALGASGTTGAQGVYMSVSQGTFTGAGSGHEHAFNSGNINGPQSLTALDIVSGGEGERVLYTAHTLTRSSGLQATGWVTSVSSDDGSSWHDPVSTYNGNQFQLECLTVMRLWDGSSGMWYCSDHSGTGAYSTNNLTSRIDASPGDGPTGSYWDGIGSSGALAYPFASDVSRAVAFPTQVTVSDLYWSDDGGETWTNSGRPSGHRGAFCYRGGRTSLTSLYAAGVSQGNDSQDSEIWWTPDAENFYSALAEEDAHGLSLDFGPVTPDEPPLVNEEILTWRDSRNFVGHSRFYVLGDSFAEARDNAAQIASTLVEVSDAQFELGVGPWTTSPTAPTRGNDEAYNNIEMLARFTWLTEGGIAIPIEVPCPVFFIWLTNQEVLDLLDTRLNDVANAGLTYRLCTRGGLPAVAFAGLTRIMRGFRSRETLRTLDPTETLPSE